MVYLDPRCRPYCDGEATASTYSDETGEPPHIHVRRDDKMLKLWLIDLTIAVNYGFAGHEISTIVRKAGEQREAFLEAWHAHFGQGR